MLNIKYKIKSYRGYIFESTLKISTNDLVKEFLEISKRLSELQIKENISIALSGEREGVPSIRNDFDFVMEDILVEAADDCGLTIHNEEIEYIWYKIEEEL